MKRSGFKRKPNAWDKIRAELKVKFEAAGITACELHYPGCYRDNYLGFAHSRKRRNANTPELMREVILADGPCHDILEAMGEEEMCRVVREVIKNRPVKII
jgi:hypothetical protein